jgi:hypothetical protein
MFCGSVLYVPEEWVLTYEMPMVDGWVHDLWSHGGVVVRLRWYNNGACSVGRYRMARPSTLDGFDSGHRSGFAHRVWEHICTYATHPLV